MNVILLVIDTFRTDHLSINGYDRKTSPVIDELAKNGIFFPNCIVTIPRTSPSIASILTGLYPHSNGVRYLHTHKLNPDAITLQEILKSHDYITIGNDIEVLGSGIEKGFDEFNLLRWRIINKIKRSIRKAIDWKYNVDPAETLTNFAIKTINKLKDEKFFLYLHYIGLHWPYAPPKPYDEMFDPDYNGEHTFNEVNGKIKRGDLIFNNNLSKREIEHAISHYDGAVRYIDSQIGRLLKCLEQLNLTEKTLVVLTGDHGESFGEHNLFFNHGDYLYDEDLKVPLIFNHPKLPKKIYYGQVQSTDIMPTILNSIGIPLIDKIDGTSLMPLIDGNKEVRKYTFAETERSYFKQNKRFYIKGIKGKWRMIRSNEWKLIYIPHQEKDIFELYNIKNDPLETKNVVEQEKDIFNEMREELFKWMGSSESNVEQDLTKKSKKLLRKLGYID